METELKKYFNQFTKDELSVTLGYLDEVPHKSAKKADLVERAAFVIGSRPREWMGMLTERDLKLLGELVSAGQGGWVKNEVPDYPCLLEILHLVYVDDRDPENVMIGLDPALFFPVAAIIDELMREKEASGAFRAERLVLGILNIFGAISAKDFVHIFSDLLDEDDNPEKTYAAILDCPYVSLCKIPLNKDIFFISPYVQDIDRLVGNRKKYASKVRKYARYDIETVIEAGRNAPFCTFGTKTDEYEDVITALTRIGYSDWEIEDIVSLIWENSQYSDNEVFTEAMFECVNERMDDIDTFDEYRNAINAIAAYANTVPKWVLKGHSSNDLDVLKISIRVDEGDAGEVIEDDGQDDVPVALRNFYNLGIGMKHVRPDDPCPCGSGLSYCRCHGKNLN